MQPTFTIILGEHRAKKDYFRAFATAVAKPIDKKNRAAKLLPYKMKKTMRLYGVSPLLLLKRSKIRIEPSSKSKGKEMDSKERSRRKDMRKPQLLLVSNDKRVDGPEIAPNFSEENEFDVVDFDFEAKNMEIFRDREKMDSRHEEVKDGI